MQSLDYFFLTPDTTAYLIIDMQERLAAAMNPQRMTSAARQTHNFIKICRELSVPVAAIRQYPKGLGEIIPEIQEVLENSPCFDKLAFSAFQNEDLQKWLKNMPEINTILLAGMETHICVLQTAVDLMKGDYMVHLLADGCVSRTEENHLSGLNYMRQAGVVISNVETAAFDLIKTAQHPTFKIISAIIK